MCFAPRLCLPKLACLAGIALIASVGCSGTQSSDQALENSLKLAGVAKETVYPFSGTVTVDGLPPNFERQNDRLIVMLNDPKEPDRPFMQRKYTFVGPQGDFAMTTYKKDDGVKTGKYIVTFAILRRAGKKGFVGPDELKNLYNDPDRNEKVEEFVINHQAPGKSNYSFKLEVAGKEAGTPGPHSLTSITDKGMKR